MSESYSYDPGSNLSARTDFNGHTTTYAYDNMNRLRSKTADAFFSTGACAPGSGGTPACGATQISYTYNNHGKRSTMTDALGVTTYDYDVQDHLAAKSTPIGDVSWTYDLAGNLTRIGGSTGLSVSYTYDTLNRLQTMSTSFAELVTYNYDDVGNLKGTQVGGLFSTGYTYDPLNRLVNMQSLCGTGAPGCGPANTPVRSYAYTLGAAGNRLSVAELNGRTVNYGYDDLYRLTSETVSGATAQNGTVGYQYDSVGNRVQLNSTLPAVPASGLLNYDANDRTSTDVYDANGNTTFNGLQNVYDFENRLVKRGGVTIVYDGDGNRVQETVAGVTTKYLVGEINPTGYVQVFAELNGTNGLLRGFEWGLQLEAVRDFTVNSFGIFHYYGRDGHGSVRWLTDSSGTISDTYDYDAFGNLISSTGTTFNNYLFAGEQFDPALGIYYNRARYYDQRSGRFWTTDTFEGDSQSPASLHKYAFVASDPTNKTDHSGHDFELSTTTIVIIVIGALVAQSLLAYQAAVDVVHFGGFTKSENKEVNAAIEHIKTSGFPDQASHLKWRLYGRVHGNSDRSAEARSSGAILLYDNFFDKSYTWDTVEQAIILFHEDVHLAQGVIFSTEWDAYKQTWQLKDQLGWRESYYGPHGRSPEGSSLWNNYLEYLGCTSQHNYFTSPYYCH